MIEDLISLREKFENIKAKGWIESLRKGTTGIGYTFETLIGKEEEQFPIPDYRTIEIKTRFRNSKENIGLFTAAPDGDYLFATKKIYDTYGYPDSKNPNYKVFYARINNKWRYAGKNCKFKLFTDKTNKQIRINVMDKNYTITDPEVSWSFQLIKEKIELKLKYIAIVKADTYFNFNKQYFKYYNITFYMIKSYETFIKLLENGIINITFMIGVYRSGKKEGMMNNHGIRFDIAEEDLEKLFIKIC